MKDQKRANVSTTIPPRIRINAPLPRGRYGRAAALPYLPRGKGALILILGGMVVLTFALFWSFIVPRRHGTPESTPPRPLIRATAHGPDGSLSPREEGVLRGVKDNWVRAVIAASIRAGLGRPELVE